MASKATAILCLLAAALVQLAAAAGPPARITKWMGQPLEPALKQTKGLPKDAWWFLQEMNAVPRNIKVKYHPILLSSCHNRNDRKKEYLWKARDYLKKIYHATTSFQKASDGKCFLQLMINEPTCYQRGPLDDPIDGQAVLESFVDRICDRAVGPHRLFEEDDDAPEDMIPKNESTWGSLPSVGLGAFIGAAVTIAAFALRRTTARSNEQFRDSELLIEDGTSD